MVDYLHSRQNQPVKKKLPDLVSENLDYTLTSVIVLENYLLKTYDKLQLQNDKEFWDCCASYIGKVYKINVPNSEWYIELEDMDNVFYNKPSLRVKDKTNFPPHSYIMTVLDRNKGDFIFTIISNHIKLNT